MLSSLMHHGIWKYCHSPSKVHAKRVHESHGVDGLLQALRAVLLPSISDLGGRRLKGRTQPLAEGCLKNACQQPHLNLGAVSFAAACELHFLVTSAAAATSS